MTTRNYKYIPTIQRHYKDVFSTSAQLTEYLEDIPVQVVLTISGCGQYAMDSLKRIETDLADSYQRTHKAPLSYAVSYEGNRRYANAHLIIACCYRVDVSYIDAILRLRKVDFKIDRIDESTKHKLLSYMFKELNFNPDCDWDFHALDFYLRPMPENSRQRRRLRRHRERLRASLPYQQSKELERHATP